MANQKRQRRSFGEIELREMWEEPFRQGKLAFRQDMFMDHFETPSERN